MFFTILSASKSNKYVICNSQRTHKSIPLTDHWQWSFQLLKRFNSFSSWTVFEYTWRFLFVMWRYCTLLERFPCLRKPEYRCWKNWISRSRIKNKELAFQATNLSAISHPTIFQNIIGDMHSKYWHILFKTSISINGGSRRKSLVEQTSSTHICIPLRISVKAGDFLECNKRVWHNLTSYLNTHKKVMKT